MVKLSLFHVYENVPTGAPKESPTGISPVSFGRVLLTVLSIMIIFVASAISLYFVLSSPPMQLFYDAAPPAGPSSIYIPGGGFSGFWFHLGVLESIEKRLDYDYYCFSSGCLGAVAVLMNKTLEEVSDAAFHVQSMWQSGNISRFELVENLFETLFLDNADSFSLLGHSSSDPKLEQVLPKLKILVTSKQHGHQVRTPESRSELKELLVQTTWIPYVTGRGLLSKDDDIFADGGFSRLLHPKCQYRLDLPIIWETLVHTFTPSLSRSQVRRLWHTGRSYGHSIHHATSSADSPQLRF